MRHFRYIHAPIERQTIDADYEPTPEALRLLAAVRARKPRKRPAVLPTYKLLP